MHRRSSVRALRFSTAMVSAAAAAAAIVLLLSCPTKNAAVVAAATTANSNAATTAAATAAAVSVEECCNDDLQREGAAVFARRDPTSIDARGGNSNDNDEDEEFASRDEEDYDDEDDDDDGTEERLPSEWTVLEYWKMHNCDHWFEENPLPPIVDSATWFYLRGLYAGLMSAASASSSWIVDDEDEGPGGTTYHSNNETETSSTLLERSLWDRQHQRILQMRERAVSQVSWNDRMAQRVGFQVPVEVRHTASRGRGVFAVEAIPEDSLVSIGGDEARFTDAQMYRAFVEMVPPELQCDIIHFSYFDQEVMGGDELDVILVALNDEAFLNADWTDEGSEANIIGIEYYDDDEWENDDDSNEEAAARSIGDGATRFKEGRRIEYVARRDIKAGEELLLKYHNFLYDDGWEVFGL